MKSHRQIDSRKAYDMWLTNLNDTVRSAVAIVLFVVIQRGWHRDRVVKLFNDIASAINTPINVFGKEVDDLYVQDYISKRYPEIDFSKINVNAASRIESQKRNKERRN